MSSERTPPLEMSARRHYSVHEIYWMAHHAARTLRSTVRSRGGRGRAFTERILLAVTEVNGCALCAYGHSRLALKAGVSAEEIRALLGGVASGVPDRELTAIVFAQHYADSRGHPDADAWRELILTYGEEQALGILGAVRMIMLGNAVGIPWSSLLSRLGGKPDPESTLCYEIGTIVGSHLLTPVALVHGGISELRGEPAISFPPRHSATDGVA